MLAGRGENPVIIMLICNFRAPLPFYLLFSVLLFQDGLLLKLCDFGTAKKLEHTLTNAVGTIRYMAPEVIRGKFTKPCDNYAYTCTCTWSFRHSLVIIHDNYQQLNTVVT